MQLLRDAWAGLDAKGRTVLVLAVTGIIGGLIYTGADLAPLWAWLGAG
jgi:hypothetical protein